MPGVTAPKDVFSKPFRGSAGLAHAFNHASIGPVSVPTDQY